MTLSSILASHGVILANKHVFWKHFCHWDYIITSCGFDISLICKRNRPPCNLFSRWFSTNVIFQSRSQIWFSWFQRNSSAQNNLCQALHIRAPAYLHSPSSVHHKGLQRLTGSHSSPKVHTRPASCCPLCSRRTHSRHNPLLAGRPCELLMQSPLSQRMPTPWVWQGGGEEGGGSRRHVSLVSWTSGSTKGGMAGAWPLQAPPKHQIQARGPLLSSLRYTM